MRSLPVILVLGAFGLSACSESREGTMSLPRNSLKRIQSPSTDFLEYRYRIPGLRPGGIAKVDSRGHGVDDLVIASSGSSTVTLFLNRGDGTFRNIGLMNSCAGGGDIDGEPITSSGNDDFLVSCGAESKLSLFAGDGQGNFERSDISVGTSPIQAQTAPYVEHAGTPYLAVLHDTPASLEILTRVGGKHFQHTRDLPVPAAPTKFVADIFTRDQAVSYAVASAVNSKISVYLNEGGSYSRTDYEAPDDPEQITAMDLRGNGYSDLVVASGSLAKFRIYFNDGNGGFRRSVDYDLPGGVAGSIDASHLRGKEEPEIIFQSGTTGDITFYPHLGGGQLGQPETIHLGSTHTGLIAGHFAHSVDGMDLAMIDTATSELVILLNRRVSYR